MRAACLLALAAVALLAGRAAGEVMPRPGPGDPHLQTVAWDPDEVVGLRIGAGYAVTLVFAPDERIETVTLGDSAGWQVTADHRADRLVVKSLGRPPPTNLTVMSDSRAYNFTLYAAEAGDGVEPYTVSFTYSAPPPPVVAPMPTRWRLHGARQLWPDMLGDDGARISIHWPAGAPIPAVYRADGGTSALVNGTMRDGVYVIEGVSGRIDFVLGDRRAYAQRLGAP